MERKLRALQRYICDFEYNHTGTLYFQPRKDRGLRSVATTAKAIMADALPIQCLEAVFLACHLTVGLVDLDRYPVSFKSIIEGHMFRHIVMAVHFRGQWGAIGLSRQESLMWKDLTFPSLSALLLDFKTCYERCHHELLKLYVGLPFGRDMASQRDIQWRVCKVRPDKFAWDRCAEVLDKFAARGPQLLADFCATGRVAKTFVLKGKPDPSPGSPTKEGRVRPRPAAAAAPGVQEAKRGPTSAPTAATSAPEGKGSASRKGVRSSRDASRKGVRSSREGKVDEEAKRDGAEARRHDQETKHQDSDVRRQESARGGRGAAAVAEPRAQGSRERT